MENIIYVACGMSIFASVLVFITVNEWNKIFKEFSQDMHGVMTSYEINIAQIIDLIDKLFDKVK